MAIRILKGPGGDRSIYIGLEGYDSNQQQPAEGYMNIFSASARICTTDATAVDIIDDISTSSEPTGNTVLVLQNVPHTELIGADNETFTSATEAVDYFNTLIQNHRQLVQAFTGIATHPSVNLTAPVNTSFDYTFMADSGINYFWRETSFPPGLSISPYDCRKIQGTPTSTGAYRIDVEVRNQTGILTTYLSVNIV